jgi:hypothetical protein
MTYYIIFLQVSLIGMALFYIQRKDKTNPGKGYHMWRHVATLSIIPLFLSVYILFLTCVLNSLTYMSLMIEIIAMDLLILTLFYYRPRCLMDNSLRICRFWKAGVIISIIIAITGFLIPFIPSM